MRSTIAVLCAVLLAACGGYDASGPSSYPGRVVLSLPTTAPMASAGETRAVTAEVTGADGVIVQAPALIWSSSAPNVATVTGSGAGATITAIDDGVATISATDGVAKGVTTITVRRRLATVLLTQPASSVAFGSTMQLTALGLDAAGAPISSAPPPVFSSSDPATLDVSASGVVTPLFRFPGVRTATISARLTRDDVSLVATAQIALVLPTGFDHAAILLTEGVRPVPLRTLAAGVAFFTVRADRIDYVITWSALSGPATSVQLHGPGGPDEPVADVLTDFGTGGGTATFGTVRGSFTAAELKVPGVTLDSLVRLMNTDKAYVDVHTAANPGGELRGQLFGPTD